MADRNILYQLKKQANKRSNPYYNPNSQEDDIRQQNKKLRAQIRNQQTKIMRLNTKIQQLSKQMKMYASMNKTTIQNEQNSVKQLVSNFSQIPMALQNRQLKDSNQILHKQNLELNGKNNVIQAELRQLRSDKYQLQLKVKQLDILQKMRAQRFQDQVDRLTPIVIEQPAEFSQIKQSITYLCQFLRKRVVQIVENIFLMSAKECQGNKKLNSFIIFRNFWNDLAKNKANGFLAVITSYKTVFKTMKLIDQNYIQFDEDQEELKGTINEWVIHSLVQIKNSLAKQEQRKLFRMLGLKYRCKYPIKGEKHELSQCVHKKLQDSICWETLRLLYPKKVRQ